MHTNNNRVAVAICKIRLSWSILESLNISLKISVLACS
jgi:hypothetical protein